MIKVEDNENILMVKRRHFFSLWKKISVIFGLGMFLSIVLVATPWISYPEWVESKTWPAFIITFVLIIFWNIGFYFFADYYLDSWVITNRRTIHTELKGLFSREQSTVKHDRVQDITVVVNGFLPTMLRYGDLHIQTAGSFKNFTFREIPDPYGTKEFLVRAIRHKIQCLK